MKYKGPLSHAYVHIIPSKDRKDRNIVSYVTYYAPEYIISKVCRRDIIVLMSMLIHRVWFVTF